MSHFRRCCLISVGLLVSSGSVQAEPPPPAQVMLIGTFHFNDPGQDAVKTKSLDVTAAPSQQYLEELTDRGLRLNSDPRASCWSMRKPTTNC